jgi:hypothetical protein
LNIFEAVRTGDLEIVKNYIKLGGNVNDTIITGSTLLMIASSYGQTGVINILLKAGADVNRVNYDGMTALMWGATPMGDPGAVRLLLDAGADVNASYRRSNTAGATALMLAASLGLAEIAVLLIGYWAEISARDNDGKTALDRALENGHEDIVKLLKEARRPMPPQNLTA